MAVAAAWREWNEALTVRPSALLLEIVQRGFLTT